MKTHDATEQAYRNGYAKGYEDAQAENLKHFPAGNANKTKEEINMKTYIQTRIINAVPAKMVNGSIWPEGLPLPEGPETCADDCCSCGIGEWLHIEEGYLYTESPADKHPLWMKKEEFERNCRAPEDLTFGDALVAVKNGKRVARKGWNGKGMYVFLARNVEFTTDADMSEFEKDGAEVSDQLVLRTTQGTLQPGWLATQSDMLSEDWQIVE